MPNTILKPVLPDNAKGFSPLVRACYNLDFRQVQKLAPSSARTDYFMSAPGGRGNSAAQAAIFGVLDGGSMSAAVQILSLLLSLDYEIGALRFLTTESRWAVRALAVYACRVGESGLGAQLRARVG